MKRLTMTDLCITKVYKVRINKYNSRTVQSSTVLNTNRGYVNGIPALKMNIPNKAPFRNIMYCPDGTVNYATCR